MKYHFLFLVMLLVIIMITVCSGLNICKDYLFLSLFSTFKNPYFNMCLLWVAFRLVILHYPIWQSFFSVGIVSFLISALELSWHAPGDMLGFEYYFSETVFSISSFLCLNFSLTRELGTQVPFFFRWCCVAGRVRMYHYKAFPLHLEQVMAVNFCGIVSSE